MFNKSNFCHIASNNRNDQKGSVFIYKTTDTLAQVTQSGYFNEKLIDINVHDLIIHVQYDPVARTLKKSVLIVTERTLDNVETAPILDQTIGDDIDQLGDQVADLGDQIDQLGDQVAGIEEKIPENASAQNQLATKSEIPTVPTNISAFNNDSGYITSSALTPYATTQALNDGLAQKQDIATAVNYDNITNCITEIPQDIKLELNNGTLTLKAGSKVYVPNGVGVFDTITIANDTVRTAGGDGTGKMLFYKNGTISARQTVAIVSGSTSPSSSLGNYLGWYDTTNNMIKLTSDGGSTWDSGWSFPFCITHDTSGAMFLDQVFNGFGYIGSTVFALPGVKGLIPNGRNEDGSLNNIQFVVEKPLYQNISATNLDVWSVLRIDNGEIVLKSTGAGTGWYNPNTNYNVFNGINNISCVVTREYFDSNGKITSFTPKTTFHAVDYNDTEFIAHQAMPSNRFLDLTLGASGSSYTAPADGYVAIRQYFASESSSNFVGIYSIPTGIDIMQARPSASDVATYMPIKKGCQFRIYFNNIIPGDPRSYFRFVYTEGSL